MISVISYGDILRAYAGEHWIALSVIAVTLIVGVGFIIWLGLVDQVNQRALVRRQDDKDQR